MTEEEFILWATLKILEMREAMGNDNSFFTTNDLDMLFKIRDENLTKIRKETKGKIVPLF